MKFYHWAIRAASPILFTVALIQIVGGFILQFTTWMNMTHTAMDTYSPTPLSGMPMGILVSLVPALSAAMFTFTAAALLWRIDLYLRRAVGVAKASVAGAETAA